MNVTITNNTDHDIAPFPDMVVPAKSSVVVDAKFLKDRAKQIENNAAIRAPFEDKSLTVEPINVVSDAAKAADDAAAAKAADDAKAKK